MHTKTDLHGAYERHYFSAWAEYRRDWGIQAQYSTVYPYRIQWVPALNPLETQDYSVRKHPDVSLRPLI